MKKNPWFLIMTVVVVILVIAFILYQKSTTGRISRPPSSNTKETRQEIQDALQDVNELSKVKVPSVNPLDTALPEVNPIEAGNPFNKGYENPFK